MSYGEDLLRELGAYAPDSGMYANLGIRVTAVGERTVELEANRRRPPTASPGRMGRSSTGERSPRSPIAPWPALRSSWPRRASCAPPRTCGSSSSGPTEPGVPVLATGECRHRTRRLAYCSATLTQAGKVVAEARATIAYLRSPLAG
jgi:hypothetical protein